MLQTVAPRPWARRMLAWYVLETTGRLEFAPGSIVEKMAAWDVLEWAKEPPNPHYGPEPEAVRTAERAAPGEEIVIDRRKVEAPVDFPVEAAIQLDHFDWERGTARGSLQFVTLFYEEGLEEELGRQHKKSWIEVDLEGLSFELGMIEMLAPNAVAPDPDLLLAGAMVPSARKAGPGRRRSHDWDGALLFLVGEAERNAIAPDPDAHGAQADIAKMLADWFADRGSPIPVNSQLQARAKQVLDQIRATNPKP